MFTKMTDASKTILAVCLWLALLVWVVFGQTLQYEFINYDDLRYIVENNIVKQGLTLRSVQWIFTNAYFSNWHPITSLTNLIDVQLYGLNAGGHHATNVLIHTATVIALFLVLRNMTGSLWRSALVAALFAIHPLRVESVAWVSERKDVLSGLFFMLTLGAYVRFSRRVATGGWKTAKGSYLIVLALFTLGLMSKSMLVTLPCVLLLLDFWPLNRLSDPSLKKVGELILEKVPLFLLTLIFCAVTVQAQRAVVGFGPRLSPFIRLGNIISSYGVYVAQLFRPTNLALFYPYPSRMNLNYIATILLLALSASWLIWLQRKRRPFLLVGWLWYIVMLIPVIGWIKVGLQAHADRYTYLPHIGLLLMLVWLIPARWMERIISRWTVVTLSIFTLVTLTALSYQQTSVWKNSQSVWEHTLNCTKDNYLACACLASVFQDQGDLDRSIEFYNRAIAINQDPQHYMNLGAVYIKKGMLDEALVQFEKVLVMDPNQADAFCNKGNILLKQNRMEEAFACYHQAMKNTGDDFRIPTKIGNELVSLGKPEEAILYYEKAARLQPNNAQAQVTIGGLLAILGRPEQAEGYFIRALTLDPEQPGIYNYIGTEFLRQKNYVEAIKFFNQALTFKPDFPAAQEGLQKAQAGLLQQENPSPKTE